MFLQGGKHTFRLEVDSNNVVSESDESNNVYETDLEFSIAKQPIPRKVNPTVNEAKIYAAYDNFTWFDGSNDTQLIEIARVMLGNALPDFDWDNTVIEGLNYQEAVEKQSIAADYPNIRSFGFSIGYGFVVEDVTELEVYFREGLLIQTLPTLARELSAANYVVENQSGFIHNYFSRRGIKRNRTRFF